MTHNDEETSFSDAYRSEILNKGQEKEKSPFPKIISILLLIVAISAISIFGYNYLTDSTTSIESKQKKISQQEKNEKVEDIKKDTLPVPVDSMIDNVEDLEDMESSKIEPTPIPIPTLTPEPIFTPTSKKNDIDQIANQMKLELSKELDKTNNTSSKKIDPTPIAPQTQKGEALYMEQLRKLSDEINREAI